MRDRISSHYTNDDDRLYRFVRNTGLPRNAFSDKSDPDVIVFVGVLAIGAVLLALFMLGVVT